MANYTATTDMTLEAAITAGPMTNGDNLYINNGATVTCTETPSILIGSVTINDGVLHIDGQNISSGNIINFIAENGSYLSMPNALSTFKVTGDWYDLGTTDGTSHQTLSLSTFLGSNLEDHLNGIWIETGRRIDYDNASGETPVVGDWVELASDKYVRGRIVEVNTASSYLVVKCLFGSLSDDDAIRVVKLTDISGPMMAETWTANVNNASGDIKEAGVYQEFGNCKWSNSSGVSPDEATAFALFADDWTGVVIYHDAGDGYITLPGTNGGFVPPSGCNVRVPNVNIGSASTTNYAASSLGPFTSTETSRWYMYGNSYGDIEISICNIGSAYMQKFAKSHTLSHVAQNIGLFLDKSMEASSADNCIIVSDPWYGANNTNGMIVLTDATSGTTITDCLVVCTYMQTGVSFSSCSNIIAEKNHIIYAPGASVSSSANALTGDLQNSVFNQNVLLLSKWTNYQVGVFTIVNANNVEITETYYAPTLDNSDSYSTSSLYLFAFTDSRDILIKGFRYMSAGEYTGSLLFCNTSVAVKCRAMGLPDDRIVRYYDANYLIYLYGGCSDIDIARMYCENDTQYNSFLNFTSSCKDIILQNVDNSYQSSPSNTCWGQVEFHGVTGLNYGTSLGLGTSQRANQGNVGVPISDFFKSATTGQIVGLMIPPGSINKYTYVTGTPLFDYAGKLYMDNGDVIEIEQDYFALGHTGFTGNITTCYGSATWNSDEWGTDVDFEFQYDLNDGDGYNGTWLDLRTASNLTGITIDPADGIKIKVRITANTDTSLEEWAIETTTTAAAQVDNLYPIDQAQCDVSLVDIVVGSRYAIYKSSDMSLLASGVAAATTVTETLTVPDETNLKIRVRNGSDTTAYFPFDTTAATNTTEIDVYISQVEDAINVN